MSTACVHKESSMGEGKEGRERKGERASLPFPALVAATATYFRHRSSPFPSPDRHLPPLPYLTLPTLPSSPRYESYFPPLVHCVRPSKKEQQNRKPPLEPTLDKVSSLDPSFPKAAPSSILPISLSSVAGSRQRSPMICLKSRRLRDDGRGGHEADT